MGENPTHLVTRTVVSIFVRTKGERYRKGEPQVFSIRYQILNLSGFLITRVQTRDVGIALKMHPLQTTKKLWLLRLFWRGW